MGFEPTTSSLGTRASARKCCIHRHLHRVFWPKTRVAAGWQLTEHSKTSHHHVTTDQLSDQLTTSRKDPPNPGTRGLSVFRRVPAASNSTGLDDVDTITGPTASHQPRLRSLLGRQRLDIAQEEHRLVLVLKFIRSAISAPESFTSRCKPENLLISSMSGLRRSTTRGMCVVPPCCLSAD
jgi:hypothetical protein